MSVVAQTLVRPARAVRGTVRVPGDKSLSHRYALFAALADGASRVTGYSGGGDATSTLACLARLGVDIAREAPGTLRVTGRGLGGLRPPDAPLDCGNSGTTMRIFAGVLAGHPFTTTLTGDVSLSRRPMRRVAAPLVEMGARIESQDGRPPLTIHGGHLHGITHRPDVPSAQVKSAVLLAGLHATGTTTVVEPASTRDHTERALGWFGVTVAREGLTVSVEGGQRLRAAACRVPGDPSAATFWAVAAAGLPGSAVTVEDLCLNPTRTGLVEVLRRAGADVGVEVRDEWQGEPVGALHVRHRDLAPFEVRPAEVPGIIDELPALAALATLGGGMRVTGAAELRVKESDRIASLVGGLRALGADAEELPDGFVVSASRRLTGGTAHAHDDHRLAMAFAIAALGATGPTLITGADAAAVSYPAFFDTLDGLRA